MKKIFIIILVLAVTKTSLTNVSCWNGVEGRGQGPDNSKCAPGQSCVNNHSDDSFTHISNWWVCK